MVSLRAHLAGEKVKMNIQHSTSNTQHPTAGHIEAHWVFDGGGWWLVVFLSLFLGNEVFAADTNTILDSWFAAQKNLQTWSADFVQTRVLQTLTQPLVATGHVWFAVPDQFRWELGRPARTIALGQGNEMFVVYPLLKRAERYPMGTNAPREWRDAMSLLQAGFPHSRKEFESQFQLLSLLETNGLWQFTLQPKSRFARQMITELRITLATNNFSLASTELVFVDGSRMWNDFTNAVLNPSLDEKLFEWQSPLDYKMVEPLKN
jgi:outer membrane lipoprotein-sorting protein